MVIAEKNTHNNKNPLIALYNCNAANYSIRTLSNYNLVTCVLQNSLIHITRVAVLHYRNKAVATL